MKILVMMSLFLPFYLKRVTGVDFFSLSFANSFKTSFLQNTFGDLFLYTCATVRVHFIRIYAVEPWQSLVQASFLNIL